MAKQAAEPAGKPAAEKRGPGEVVAAVMGWPAARGVAIVETMEPAEREIIERAEAAGRHVNEAVRLALDSLADRQRPADERTKREAAEAAEKQAAKVG